MQELLPNIFKVYRDSESGGWGYSFLVTRPQGNIFFARMAQTASIENEYDAIDAVGGISAIYITDFHFAGKHVEHVSSRFNAPIYCSEVEKPKIIKRGIHNVTAFDFTQQQLEDDLLVIPTPGHTSGGVCYLLALNHQNYLFTGDLIYFNGNSWVIGSKKYSDVKSSFDSLLALDFNILIGCGDDALGIPYVELTQDAKVAFFDKLKGDFS
ncbi:MAG: MBL fold metallo-hydrolase [Chloroflexota bacterium]